MGGTLVVSRAVNLFENYKKKLNELGFDDVLITDSEKDGLNFIINDKKPRLMIIDSKFYKAGTPYMTGELVKMFPNLNIAAVSLYDFPNSLSPWFIWRGVRSYLNLWDMGYDEFYKSLRLVNEGKRCISPLVERFIEQNGEWPDVKNYVTDREQECLVMMCCGLSSKEIGNKLHLCRNTIDNYFRSLYKTFNVASREEMIAVAWCLELVTPNDIQFYSDSFRKKGYGVKIKLPEWVEIKSKYNNFSLIKQVK